jgi:hypothetical protein
VGVTTGRPSVALHRVTEQKSTSASRNSAVDGLCVGGSTVHLEPVEPQRLTALLPPVLALPVGFRPENADAASR